MVGTIAAAKIVNSAMATAESGEYNPAHPAGKHALPFTFVNEKPSQFERFIVKSSEGKLSNRNGASGLESHSACAS